MNVSPVSFRATTASKSDFTALISRPQTYAHIEKPAAATTIEGNENKKSPFKKILGIALGGVCIAAGLALGAKYGILNPKEGGHKYVELAKSKLKFVGDKVLSYANSAISVAQTKWGELKTHLPKIKDSVAGSN